MSFVMRNQIKFDYNDPFWVLTLKRPLSDNPPTAASYTVTSSADEELNTGFDGESFTVVDNKYRKPILEEARAVASKTQSKLVDGQHAIRYRKFQYPRAPASNDNHWITCHACDVELEGAGERYARILKVGTSDKAEYWKTIQDECKRAVGKSYSFCKPGTIRVDVYPGAPTKEANDKLEECLRNELKPAGEEDDVVEARCNLTGTAGMFLDAARASMLSKSGK
mmetsp:Transcript_9896/g.26390  ORF Transcript_9896/g.26390 Transcript_9896/m.26390 type:complete len:224 (-) Transcript_9896:129-800(-)